MWTKGEGKSAGLSLSPDFDITRFENQGGRFVHQSFPYPVSGAGVYNPHRSRTFFCPIFYFFVLHPRIIPTYPSVGLRLGPMVKSLVPKNNKSAARVIPQFRIWVLIYCIRVSEYTSNSIR